MKKNNCLVVFLWLFMVVVGFGQEFPPITVYTPEVYGGENQNWSIAQSKDKYIYVANNKGLLEFDGARWTLYNSPNETIIRVVKTVDSLVYTASFQEFGFWKKDSFGLLNYTSLSDKLKVDFLEDEEIWNIVSFDKWLLFQSLDRIYVYNQAENTYRVINSISKISRLFKVQDQLYFQNVRAGLYKIENGSDILVSNDEVLKDNIIVNVFNLDDKLLILTQDRGFFQLTNGELEPWHTTAETVLNQVSVFSGIKLRDGGFALGTISDGLIYLTEKGDLRYQINQSNGLSNNTVLALFEDVDFNIWLGLDNGIDCINSKSPFLQYLDNKGVIGSVYISKVFNNTLYLGSNQGLFSRALTSDTDFQFIAGTQGQVWCLEVIDNSLFCGHNSGTFLVEGNKAEKIANMQGTWQIKTIENHDNLLIQGNYNGLNILEKIDGKWQLRNKIEGFNISSRYFEFLDDETLFVSHEYKGVFKLKLDGDFNKILDFEKDKRLQKGLVSSLVKYQNNLFYSTKEGVYKYDKASRSFQKDSLVSKLIDSDNYTSGKLIPDVKTNKLWSFSKGGIHYLTASKLSSQNKIETVSFPSEVRRDIIGFESITHVSDTQFLVGSATGYFIFDVDKILNPSCEIRINRVESGRTKDVNAFRNVSIQEASVFENQDNNIRFSYSIPQFLKIESPKYQYKLEGLYDDWSDWSSDGTVFFENLPYGNYTFVVKGLIGSEPTLNMASFSFKIKPPFLLSNTAIVIYFIGILLFSLFMHMAYKRYYKKQRERLLQKTTNEFELKALEDNQKLMRFKNDKLREDIENKNRELGMSTMNLIKKNEFLNSLKKELENADTTKSLKSVIRIIDKNINNADDWNLFQEAFNNADKDFLKKVKQIHPTLTSNDLRLCAYLRLNLSSKEIAPLLNISPRSVEVKRYRLRKKMELPHETSLTNYILEL
ncbi:triple tyrosine motif-containing protein [Algibacter miyuki]|uniref:Triple tyrosine motif-containing protein n=1 Tax=Algibacter miyuki TaxID=1306933 RepID=A0ABV5GV89_9FLAO|nr:triple tyrosine motif-containing protein [Algibacter miyuki]MDN3664827.1 triple tyrosine motif-containing protein [Algibacter miyuki]